MQAAVRTGLLYRYYHQTNLRTVHNIGLIISNALGFDFRDFQTIGLMCWMNTCVYVRKCSITDHLVSHKLTASQTQAKNEYLCVLQEVSYSNLKDSNTLLSELCVSATARIVSTVKWIGFVYAERYYPV